MCRDCRECIEIVAGLSNVHRTLRVVYSVSRVYSYHIFIQSIILYLKYYYLDHRQILNFRFIETHCRLPSREKVAPFLDDLGVGALGGFLDDQIVDVDGGEHHQTERDHVNGRPDEAIQRSGGDHVVLVHFSRVCFPVQVGGVEHFDKNLTTHS